MAEMWLEKRQSEGGTVFVPTLDSDPDKLSVGEVIRVEWTRPRNHRMHRKFWALVKVGFDNQSHYVTLDQFRHVLMIELGRATPVFTIDGIQHWIPESISFAKMDQSEFDRLYDQVLDLLVRKYVAGADPRQLNAAAEAVLGFV